MNKTTISIEGMHCASCAQNIKINLDKNENIKFSTVNFASKKAIVEHNDKISLEEIKEIIQKTGYEVIEANIDNKTKNKDRAINEKKEKYKMIFAIILTLPIFIRMFWIWEIPGEILQVKLTNWIQLVLSLIVVFGFGINFHMNAIKALKNKQTNMDTLISIGTLSAFFYSVWAMFHSMHLYFESAATITSLILLGKFLELKSKNRASKAMEKLLELGVKKARLIDSEGNEKEMDIEKVRIDDILLIKPSEKFPLDGFVIDGESSVDESMLTGESLPVHKLKESKVFAATINLDGIIKMKVTKTGEGTVYSQIIKTVEEAQNFKPPVQRLADKISGIFVPIVISLSALTFITWYLISSNIEISLINAVSVLIISCPCALGIATPIAVMVGTSVGAKNGILIKDGESFERAKKINTAVFDKTGTLTIGKPKIDKLIINNESNITEEEKIIKIAYSLSSNSEHPLSKAITNNYKDKLKINDELTDIKEITGKGIIAKSENNKIISLGNIKLLKHLEIESKWAKNFLEEQKNYGGTILFVSHNFEVLGSFLVSDKLKPNSSYAINNIKKIDITPIMISGDNKNSSALVAKKLNIDYLAEVLPHEKQNEIKKLQEKGKQVVFVGDGINDAPSLIQADLGIAMGSGTDIAKESGNIIIMKNDPLKVVEAIKLSKKTFSIIKQNLFWAFFYNVIAIPLAMLGLVNPMIGALAMGLSDVTVIGNSLRIYKK